MNTFGDLVLSQTALQDYVECPRRFELRYLRQLNWPALETRQALELESSMERGHEFHHLLHQHAMGVPAEVLGATIDDEVMVGWWRNYLEWQERNLPQERYPELSLTTSFTGSDETEPVLLMAKYDLVTRLADGTLLIVDWKTGRPQRRSILAERLQTVVYRYVLSRAGDWLNGGNPIEAERIRMTYWYATDSTTVDFDYDGEAWERDERRLASIIGSIRAEIQGRYEFPKTPDERGCRFCTYRSLCERGVEAGVIDGIGDPNVGLLNQAGQAGQIGGPDLEDLDAALSFDLDDLGEVSF